jgi:hypothetical protein
MDRCALRRQENIDRWLYDVVANTLERVVFEINLE